MSDHAGLGWMLLVLGLVIAGIGLVWILAPSIPWLGRLPGDIRIRIMVRPFALSVPPVEAVLGTLLCLGLFTRWTLIAGGLWMVALVFGTTVRQDYPTVAIQLLYALLFFVLQVWEPSNRISLDALIGESRPK